MVKVKNNNVLVDETMTPWEHLETFLAKTIVNMLILKYGADKYNFKLTLREPNIIINSPSSISRFIPLRTQSSSFLGLEE
ncbi:MAG: hypothetical protein QXO70_00525 [Candidatus Pacearchaeota archaeon]